MSKTVNIFFNNREFSVGPNGEWCSIQNPDPLRLATMTALSWEGQGWIPSFYDTKNVLGFSSTGRLAKDRPAVVTEMEWFQNLNNWFEIARLAPGWFCHIDVFNAGFTPDAADALEKKFPNQCINAQYGTFCLGCLFVPKWYALRAIELVRLYDRGGVSDLPYIETVSDEHILRHLSNYVNVNVMSFAYANPDWKRYPLIHLMRSGMRHAKI